MNKNNILFFSFLIIALFLSGCATNTTSSSKKNIPPKKHGGTISMPSGWDDSIIDRIKAGKSTKKVLAVLDFEGNNKLKGKVDLKMSDMLTTSLFKTARFEIVERNKIDKVFKEQNLGLSGMVDENTAAEVGKLLGAEYVVFGSITSATRKDEDKFGYILVRIEVGIDVRAVNTSSGKLLLSESALGVSKSKLVKTADGVIVSGAVDYNSAYADASRDAIMKVGSKIADLSPLIGFVLTVDPNQILIDIGEEQGVKNGDTFVAFAVGDEILHPATGKHIGWKKEILQELKVVSTEKIMSSTVKIRSQSSKQLNPGDFVISR
jgi:curli biogenesis system outer membrane secretion channel CsgG